MNMIGQTISHYKILEKLGEGGMGVVYKARDTNLDRDVALKFLPSHLSASEQDKARFIQEAKAASALNHPNVCTIHDIQEHDLQMFIVMEFVDGQTLREKKEAISFKQAIDIGIQIADGLAAAHEKGIVHRDIKPENIMIRKDGIAQIMDFGLAKLRGNVSRLTKEGSTVGTVGYMSPEQVQGRDADHRSDIFSLGVLLYELFPGQPPFKGVHETALAYEIVNVDAAPMSSVKPEIDPSLDAIILECLEKDLNERAQSVKQVSIDLKRFKRESSKQRVSRITAAREAYSPTTQRPSATLEAERRFMVFQRFKRDPVAWSFVALLLLGAVVFAGMYFSFSSVEKQIVRSFIPPPEKANFHFYGFAAGPPVVSPDGHRIAFVAVTADGQSMLYVRSLDALTARPLAGTEDAHYPFWSPDNKFIGFFAQGKLKKIDASGGPPVSIADALNARGGSWNNDGNILFVPGAVTPVYLVSATGGTPAEVTKLDSSRMENSHRWPYFLSDGKHFLYFARTVAVGAEAEGDALYIASIDSKVNKILVGTSANAAYASGYLLFTRGFTLMAQRLDESDLELKGEPFAIADSVLNDAGFNLAVFSASQNGILVYQSGRAQAGARLVYVDRSGKEVGLVGDLIEHYSPRISPDGKKVVVNIFDPKFRIQNLWIYELGRGIKTRFTSGLASDFQPIWSPDGSSIVFNSIRKGKDNLYKKPSSGVGIEEILYESNENQTATDWLYDGKVIVFNRDGGSGTRTDIWILPLFRDKKPFVFLQTRFNEWGARFSPNGQWIAYTSDETGENEIYIRPFPGPGSAVKVSIAGGDAPALGRDGRELFYISKDNKVMAAEVQQTSSGVAVKSVRPLFARSPFMTDYDVFADGQRFLMNRLIEPQSSAPITLVVNWDAELGKK